MLSIDCKYFKGNGKKQRQVNEHEKSGHYKELNNIGEIRKVFKKINKSSKSKTNESSAVLKNTVKSIAGDV